MERRLGVRPLHDTLEASQLNDGFFKLIDLRFADANSVINAVESHISQLKGSKANIDETVIFLEAYQTMMRNVNPDALFRNQQHFTSLSDSIVIGLEHLYDQQYDEDGDI